MVRSAQRPGDQAPFDPQRPLLEAAGVWRRRPDGAGWLLEDVSLQLMPGARLALRGPSGAGKTLLLRSLALLDPVDAGQVLYHGQPVRREEVPPFRARVIYLHQSPVMLGQTVEEALRRPFGLGVHRRRSFDRARIVGWLGKLGRDESFLQQAAGELSGGERQLVALLRAMQLEPEVLLLDEPTAALDAKAAAAVKALVEQWMAEAAGRRGLVWVGHDPAQAGRLAEETLWMDRGRLTDRPGAHG